MKCKKCGAEVNGNFCPNCGAKAKRKHTVLYIVLGFVAFIAIMAIIGSIIDSGDTATAGDAPTPSLYTTQPQDHQTTEPTVKPTLTVVPTLTPEPTPEPTPKPTPNKLTMDKFNALETGMSYEEVVAVLGMEGELGSVVDIGEAQFKTETYTFKNSFLNGGGVIIVQIQGGVLVTKAQSGLD